MRNRVPLIILLTYCCLAIACRKDPAYLGTESAQRKLRKVLAGSTYVLLRGDTLIKNKDAAIMVAEAALFPIFGKSKIRSEQPYETYLIDGYWVISGTLPRGWDGGTFEVIINAIDGRFVYLSHGK